MPYLAIKTTIKTEYYDGLSNLPVLESSYEFRPDAGNSEAAKLSQIFKGLCDMKFSDRIILDFTVTRCSLEQVFVQFAKHQV